MTMTLIIMWALICNSLAMAEEFSFNNSDVIVSKCCDEDEIFNEMTSECSKGIFEAAFIKHILMDDMETIGYLKFETGALIDEHCLNGSKRWVILDFISKNPFAFLR